MVMSTPLLFASKSQAEFDYNFMLGVMPSGSTYSRPGYQQYRDNGGLFQVEEAADAPVFNHTTGGVLKGLFIRNRSYTNILNAKDNWNAAAAGNDWFVTGEEIPLVAPTAAWAAEYPGLTKVLEHDVAVEDRPRFEPQITAVGSPYTHGGWGRVKSGASNVNWTPCFYLINPSIQREYPDDGGIYFNSAMDVTSGPTSRFAHRLSEVDDTAVCELMGWFMIEGDVAEGFDELDAPLGPTGQNHAAVLTFTTIPNKTYQPGDITLTTDLGDFGNSNSITVSDGSYVLDLSDFAGAENSSEIQRFREFTTPVSPPPGPTPSPDRTAVGMFLSHGHQGFNAMDSNRRIAPAALFDRAASTEFYRGVQIRYNWSAAWRNPNGSPLSKNSPNWTSWDIAMADAEARNLLLFIKIQAPMFNRAQDERNVHPDWVLTNSIYGSYTYGAGKYGLEVGNANPHSPRKYDPDLHDEYMQEWAFVLYDRYKDREAFVGVGLPESSLAMTVNDKPDWNSQAYYNQLSDQLDEFTTHTGNDPNVPCAAEVNWASGGGSNDVADILDRTLARGNTDLEWHGSPDLFAEQPQRSEESYYSVYIARRNTPLRCQWECQWDSHGQATAVPSSLDPDGGRAQLNRGLNELSMFNCMISDTGRTSSRWGWQGYRDSVANDPAGRLQEWARGLWVPK